MDYYKLFIKWADKFPKRKFLQLDNNSCSYNDVRNELDRLKECFCFNGRNRVLVIGQGIYFQLCAFLFLQAQGQIPVLAHDDLPPESVKQIMREHNMRFLLSDMSMASLGFDKVQDNGGYSLYETMEVESEVPANVCMGVLSSGSTSVPKLFMRTYESWADFMDEQNTVFGISEDSKVFIEGSLSFTGNLNVVAAVLYAGAVLIATRRFKCHYWEQLLRKYEASVIYMVPTKLKLLVRSISRPLNGIQSIFSGSQLIDEALLNKLKEKLPKAEVVLYYGATELNYITYLRGDEISRHPMSVGKPFKGVTVTINAGRIYVDSPYFVYGAECPYTVNDSGHFDEAGYLIFEGRQENIINKGGFKVSCLKVEQAICSIDGVSQAVVLSVESKLRGSELVTFIQADDCINNKKIYNELKHILQRTEIPKKLMLVKELPLNSIGKINREKLKKMLTNH